MRWRGRAIGLAVLALLALVRVADPPVLGEIRASLFDVQLSAKPREWTLKSVVIVDIDEKSLAELGQWPWPRTLLARLMDRVADAKPLAVGLDLLFPEPDRLSPDRLVQRIPNLGNDVREALLRLPSNDDIFAASLERVPAVLGMAAVSAAHNGVHERPLVVAPVVAVGGDPKPHLFRYGDVIRSIETIDRRASGRAALTVAPEHDGIVRRVPLVLQVGDTIVPTLTIEMLRIALKAPAYRVHVDRHGVTGVSIDDVFIPTRRDGRLWVHYTPHEPGRYVSAVDLLEGRVSPTTFADRFVLIGTTGLGLTDFAATPVAPSMPGVEVHAQLLETIVAGQTLQRPFHLVWAEVALLVLAGLAIVWAVPAMPPSRSVLPLLAAAAIFIAISWIGYVGFRTLVDASYPLAGSAAVYAVMLATTLVSVDRHRKQLARDLQAEREAAARLEGELDAARSIQMGILPREFPAYPDRKEFDLFATIEPARAVGGDLYDFALVDGDQLYFMVGDVSGKGVPAALFMALTKALYRSSAVRRRIAINDIMTEANAEVSRENPATMFVTIAAGILQLKTGELSLCNAGHDAPLLLRAGAPATAIETTGGPPLCAIEDFAYPVDRFRLQPGDAILLYTDGVSEAMNAAGELYTAARARAALERAGPDTDMAGLVAALLSDIRGFVGAAEPSDDITVLALRWNGPPAD